MPPGTEVLVYDVPGTLRVHVAVEGTAAAGFHHFHHRLAMAHAIAAHRLDCGARSRGELQHSVHGLAAASHAAGTEPDPEFHSGLLYETCPSASHAVAGVSRPAVCPSTDRKSTRLNSSHRC